MDREPRAHPESGQSEAREAMVHCTAAVAEAADTSVAVAVALMQILVAPMLEEEVVVLRTPTRH